MSLQQTVHQIVKDKGPILPAEIVSEVARRTGEQRDMFFIGAILSELMSSGNVKMSHSKIGGSRLYYCPGQEEGLEKLQEHLNDKEKKAFDLLKEKKVLRGSAQEPIVRVALSQIKDFSKPIEVKLKDTETFWRWYNFPVEDAKNMIKDMIKDEINNMKKQDSAKAPEMTPKPAKPEQDNTQKKEETFIQHRQSESDVSKPEMQRKENIESDFITTGDNNPRKDSSKNSGEDERRRSEEKQSKLGGGLSADDEFLQKTRFFLESKGVKLFSAEVLKKNSECEFEADCSTQLGNIRLYIFAKSKKKLNENDLGYAYVRAKNKNLELCFVATGELTKKAQDMLEDEFRSIIFLKMR